MKITKIISSVMISLMFATGLTSCDEHIEVEDTSLKVGQILCTDGSIVALEQIEPLRKQPIAVVFYVNHGDDNTIPSGTGLAAYLWDVKEQAFSDSIGVSQGTSTSFTACDGNSNTYALYNNKNANSPMAQTVFDLWHNGRSCYVPSVGEMRLMFYNRGVINKYSQILGGTALSDKDTESFYWTSTEVAGQAPAKAWVYSLTAGTIQEAPKTQSYKIRPIVTLYN